VDQATTVGHLFLLDELQPFEIGFGLLSTDQEVPKYIRWQRGVRLVVVNHYSSTVLMTINALTPLALGELEAIIFESVHDAADRDIPQERDRRVHRTHTVTATTG
jgi:hypothetical protein